MNAQPALRPWRRASIAVPAPAATLRQPAPGGEPLPARLRVALEHLSGLDLGGVRVHRGSALPALLGARAFAYGEHVYLSAGAESALAHEAWHVVQQMQGRVPATGTVNGLPLNDDAALEAEAEWMAAEAVRWSGAANCPRVELARAGVARPLVQRAVTVTEAAQDENRNWWPRSWDATQQAGFEESIQEELRLDATVVPNVSRIAQDLIAENRTFADWPAVAREIRIRDVGYAVVAQMEALTATHRPEYDTALAALNTWYDDARAQFLRDEEQGVPADQREFADSGVLADEKVRRWAEACAGILLWTNPSYTTQRMPGQVDREMYRWLGGVRDEDPLRMNCWETVLYSLVRTGRVSRSYITWCNAMPAESAARMPPESSRPVNFCNEALRIMDCFFLSPPFRRAEDERVQAGAGTWMSGAARLDCHDPLSTVITLDPTFVIPRGRMVIFQANASLAGHVAISTGQMRDYVDPATGLNRRGHEIIENDFAPGTLRYGTIEQLRSYLNEALVITPFPVCTASRQLTFDLSAPLTGAALEDFIRQKRDAIDQTLATDIQAARDEAQPELRKWAANQAKCAKLQAQLDKKIERLNKTAEYERGKLENEKTRDKLSKEAGRTLRFDLSYGPNDPYGGTVRF